MLNGLAEKGWEIHYQANGYMGQTLPPGNKLMDGTELNFTMYGQGNEAYAKDLLIPRIRELRPDIFCTLLDTFMMYPWFMDMNFAPAKTAFYFPSDGGGNLPMGCDQVLRHVDLPIAMAKFGQQQCKEVHNLDTEYIPHGVWTKQFKPYSKKLREQKRAEWGLSNKFVIGVVARNQGRKMLDRTIKAFAEFAKDKPDVILLMHSDPEDKAQVFDIRYLIERYKIANKILFTGTKYFKGFTYEQMVDVYNVMDVFFLSTSGEGFGIPTVEAMSCGIPVVATDYTTTQELIVENGLCGLPVKVAAEITGSWAVERAVMDIEAGVKALNELYDEPQLRKQFGKVGREKAIKYYDWQIVIDRFDELFTRLIE